MKHDDIKSLLKASLEDHALSRGESKTLKALLDDAKASVGDRRALVSHAFGLASADSANSGSLPVLAWLESVCVAMVAEGRVESSARSMAEVHFSPGDGCRRRIEALFDAARISVDVCVFTITDDRITDTILKARRRGVVVRVVSDNEKGLDPGSDLERLRDGGVGVAVDDSPHHMHHKFAVFDGRIVLAGSYNWTRSAADCNEEDLVVSDDSRFVAAFRSEFDRLWNRFAKTAS